MIDSLDEMLVETSNLSFYWFVLGRCGEGMREERVAIPDEQGGRWESEEMCWVAVIFVITV